MGGDLEREYQVTAGLSRSLIDYKFSLGLEGKAAWVDTKADRGNFEKEYFLGPSVQYRPSPPLTVNFAPTIGLAAESPDAQIWLNVGYEF